MKQVINKKTSILKGQLRFIEDRELASENATYKDLIETVLDMVPQAGFTHKEIRNRNRIQDVIDSENKESNKEEFNFEDADYENLKNIVMESRWRTRHKDIEEFLSSFEK